MASKSPSEEVEYVPERIKKIERKLESNPYDVESWNSLIREAQTQSINKARRTYERLVSQFPSAGRYWRIYIEHEMKSRNYEKVEKLFQRCLMKVLNIDLWKCYLNYVKETKSGLSSYREKMAQAYDFAIDKIGMDIMSYQLWADYVAFLKSVEAVGSYAENQRITAVRRVYQRGCVNPMLNIEQLWREYNAYEQSINPIIAKKMVDDRTRDYINARRVSKELETMTRGLQRNNPATPPNPANPDEAKQVNLWKKYIEWEKDNPLRTEDSNIVTRRVMFAYEQCLLCLGQHPDVWYEAVQFLVETSKKMMEKGDTNSGKILADEAASMFERAISNLKDNMLLHFAYSDFEEGRMKFDKVHNIYQKLLDCKDIDQTLTYIQYMKFARRAEGIKTARSVFKRAREDNRVRFHVYVAAALMEYYCTKEKQIAFKIFELGLKRFGDEPDYLLSYIDYMSHLNEDNNTRVLFERVLTSGSLPPDKSGKIWDEYLEFECNVGDLSSILKVEKRRLEAFKKEYDGKTTCLLVDRYRFLDLFPCTPEQLKSIGYKDSRARPAIPGIPVPLPSASENATSQQTEDNEPVVGVGVPTPDLSQMIPFKPRINPHPGMHLVPGGDFPMPTAAASLVRSLPPPHCFHGPFPILEEVLDKFMEWKMPDEKEWLKQMNSGEYDPHRLLKVSKGQKRASSNHDDSDDESRATSTGVSGAPPANDIYRARQQKRVR